MNVGTDLLQTLLNELESNQCNSIHWKRSEKRCGEWNSSNTESFQSLKYWMILQTPEVIKWFWNQFLCQGFIG